jgi:hypothetical protein
MSCPTGKCPEKCGKGTANVDGPSKTDPVFVALCEILCEARREFCEGKHKGKKRGEVAEQKARDSQKLKDAIGSKKTAHVNKNRLVKYPNADPKWKRSPVSPDQLAKQLEHLKGQLRKKITQKIGEKALKKAATAWARFIPVVGWGMAAYDVYDIGKTAIEFSNEWKNMTNQFSGRDVYQVRPDVAILDENGKLDSIYDFKMDNPETGFTDDWNDGQKEMYDQSLKNDGSGKTAKSVNGEDCGCDLPMGSKTMPGYVG